MEERIENLYKQRFNPGELRKKRAVWKVLCKDFFQKYIKHDDVVLDLGSGHGEFIDNIECGKKFAVEPYIDTKKYIDSNVVIYKKLCTDLSCFGDGAINIVFVSNLFEHLKSKEDIVLTLEEIYRILKKNGKLLLLQPNIKYIPTEYWDFFDHNIPLTHKSMIEVLRECSFRISEVRPKFLPHSTKSRFPKLAFLVKFYLKFKPLQFVFGKQMFIVAKK